MASSFKLVSIYDWCPGIGFDILYDLLKERESKINISHKALPAFKDHVKFIESKPYKGWFFIVKNGDGPVGSIYLTKKNEIGVFIFKANQHKGYGLKAAKLLIKKYPKDRILANINPANKRSIDFFGKLGFKHIQNTYELRG